LAAALALAFLAVVSCFDGPRPLGRGLFQTGFAFILAYISFKVRAVYKRLEVAAPTVFGVQGFPVCPKRSKDSLVPNDLSIFEKIQIYRAPL
jgi:hypothetical protein